MSAYQDAVRKRYTPLTEQQMTDEFNKTHLANGDRDFSGPTPESAQKIDWLGRSNLTQNDVPTPETVPGAKPESSGGMSGGAAAAQSIAQGGSPLDAAGSGMMIAGLSGKTMNPYLVGAGVGVSALSSIQKGKNQREQNQYLAEVQKYNQRQDAISKMASIGQSLKA